MFKRTDWTYDIDSKIVDGVLKDEANPLNQISKIIPEGSKVLDIGAGNGILARVLQQTHKDITIDGIELNNYAANLAKKYYRSFYFGFAQDFMRYIAKENYDFVILADVIEHMDDPLAFLQDLCSNLSKKSRVILSVPNVAFGAVRLSLLNGDFEYVGSGILEKTHLRFFTLKSLDNLIMNSHMNIEKICYLQRNLFESEIKLKKIGLSPLLKVLRDKLSATYQFLVILTKEKVKTDTSYFGKRLNMASGSYFYMKTQIARLKHVTDKFLRLLGKGKNER